MNHNRLTERLPMPYVRTGGEGPTVLCLHSSTSSSKQFRGLIERLAGSFRVVAVDLYGYGQSPDWDAGRSLSLYDEVALLEPIFAAERGPLYLVGHSYGGAVALKAATMLEQRIAGMVLYEPVLFSLLDYDTSASARREIDRVRDDVRTLIVQEAMSEAGQRFVDYWSGKGAWASLPEWQRTVISGRMRKVVDDFDAVMNEPTPLSRFAAVRIPTKLMAGSESPHPTTQIISMLADAMPDNLRCEIDGAGHMGPMTHAERVNRAIDGFLTRVARHSTVERYEPRPSEALSGVYDTL